uniref:protein-serine/threonine phosphatase n=1 Tax=Electrophorus electricus TaxID=8005 RepID=A0A4W4G154_ELEEL
MALLTLHRSPSVSTAPDECIPRRGILQKRESFAVVKGAVLLLEEGARLGIHEETTPPLYPNARAVGGESGTQHRHLHAMVSLLRPEDTIKLAVQLESVSSVRLRYLLIITTASHKQESLLLGMDFPHMSSDHCTIGLVMPIWSDTQVYLDGDGGFSVTSAEVTRIFKPVSIQTMWSVLQALHGCCERAVHGAVIPGCSLDWAQHYQHHMESDQHCLNEWRAMTGLESVRKDSKGSSTEREAVESEIKAQLRDIMRTEDLESITSKQVRSALEARIGMDMKNYKEYIDNEMMVTMAQMDKPSKILDYLYLGSEWNAANFEELQKNNVGYILNVTMEIDNFYPESFTYMNVRVYDVEATDLLAHWNNTYMFINDARQGAVLVHCKMGVSRSASTVMAFLMKQQGWGLDHALNYVRERRPIVQPNDSFFRQLQIYSGILSVVNILVLSFSRSLSQVSPSPSRSGRMDLFSLMQSIQLDDDDRLSDLEVSGKGKGGTNINLSRLNSYVGRFRASMVTHLRKRILIDTERCHPEAITSTPETELQTESPDSPES